MIIGKPIKYFWVVVQVHLPINLAINFSKPKDAGYVWQSLIPAAVGYSNSISIYSGTCLRVYSKFVSQSSGPTSLGLCLHVYKDLKTGMSTTQPNLPKVIHPQGNVNLRHSATEDTMRPFRGPDLPSRRATTPAGIVNKVKGSVVHRPGMTPVDGLWPAG